MKTAVSGLLIFFVVLLGLELSAGAELSTNKTKCTEMSCKSVAFLCDGQVSQQQEGLLLNSASEHRLYEESRTCSNGKVVTGFSASFFFKETDLFDKHPKESLLAFTASVPIYLKFHSLRL